MVIHHAPFLTSGLLCEAIDVHGQGRLVRYGVLTNGGGGNGVLICAAQIPTVGMPKLLAFGRVAHAAAEGGEDLGYWRFWFHSFTACEPTLRGTAMPERNGTEERIELRVILSALQPFKTEAAG
ncbi:hypothetical protein [Deinococcus ruber]|uniref:Uncharacterized protein n=1 Tax=Deinococcus ruber TaxID=1848197 RepID=A0A918C7J9_9DEIO|nr:hypothetical protein [Deinococcus ruber]GGR09651.1 hypothetical protein GCM10008957_22990 [Deinococcus ruber]